MLQIINGKKEYMRRCRRCGELYLTPYKSSKYCDDCKLPPYQKGKSKFMMRCFRCGTESIGITTSRSGYIGKICEGCGFRTNHKMLQKLE